MAKAVTYLLNSRDLFTAFFENAAFFKGDGKATQPKKPTQPGQPPSKIPAAAPFYVDPGTNPHWNFGYGYDLTANKATYAADLKEAGVPETVITGVLADGVESVVDEKLGRVPTDRDVDAALSKDVNWKPVALKLLDNKYELIITTLTSLLKKQGIVLSALPAGVRLALEDLAYNGGAATSAIFGSGKKHAMRDDLLAAQKTKDFSAVAFELAFDTASLTADKIPYERRCLANTARVLGLTVTVDEGHNLTAVSGDANLTQIKNFLQITEENFNVDRKFLLSSESFVSGAAFLKAIDAYTVTKGLFVAYGSSSVTDKHSILLSTSKLDLINAKIYGGTISGFDIGETIHLVGVSTKTVTLGKSNVLTLTDSAGARFQLHLAATQDYSGDQFKVASDGAGGSNLTVIAKNLPPSGGNKLYLVSEGGLVDRVDPKTGAAETYAIDRNLAHSLGFNISDIEYVKGVGLIGFSVGNALYKLSFNESLSSVSDYYQKYYGFQVHDLGIEKVVDIKSSGLGEKILSLSSDADGHLTGLSGDTVFSIDLKTGDLKPTFIANTSAFIHTTDSVETNNNYYFSTDSGLADGGPGVIEANLKGEVKSIKADRDVYSISKYDNKLIGFGSNTPIHSTAGNVFSIDPISGKTADLFHSSAPALAHQTFVGGTFA